MVHRAQPPLVLAVRCLGFVHRHIDPGGTVPAARLAGEAQVQRILHGSRVPVQRPARQILQDSSPPSGNVFLILSGLVGRAHETTGREIVGATLTNADTTVYGCRKISAVLAERKPPARNRLGVGPAKGRGDRRGVNQHAGVQ